MYTNRIASQVLIVGSVLLAGCSSSPAVPTQEKCLFPDAVGGDAPLWVCHERLDGGPKFQAMGSARLGGNRSLAESKATAVAQVKLAGRMNISIKNMIESYAAEVASTDGDVINTDSFEETTRRTVKQNIIGSHIIRKVVSSSGDELYVLMVMNPADVKEVVGEVIDVLEQENNLLKGKMNLGNAMKRLDEKVQ